MWFSTLLLKNLLRRKFRSLLTCVGFAVAVGTTVALLGVAESFERTWIASMTERGFDIIVVEAGKPDQQTSRLDETFGQELEEIPGVETVAPSLVEGIGWEDGTTVILQGWEAGSVLFEKVSIVEGRMYQPNEPGVALVGKQLAQAIDKTMGDTIELQGEEFEIIGLSESYVHFENSAVTIPLSELQKLMWRKGEVTGFAVVLDESYKRDPDSVDAVAEQINNLELTSEDGIRIRMSAMKARDFVQNTFQIKVAQAMAWITSTIAVIVGSIGVLNTMIMSVVERIREISILRAIGWKKSRVVRMILGEALILSLVGAVLGILAAILLVQSLTTLPLVAGFIEGRIGVSVILKGMVLALVVGVLGGAYPAWHAAQLLPSEGLRHE